MTFVSRLWLVALMAVASLLLIGCSEPGSSEAQGSADAELPEWLDRVYPQPGAELSATQAVQVDYQPATPTRAVRLSIDGTDVTAYAAAGPGRLEYDIDQAAAPVELESGSHTATVELYSVEPGASEGVESYNASEHEVLDTFTWDFTVL